MRHEMSERRNPRQVRNIQPVLARPECDRRALAVRGSSPVRGERCLSDPRLAAQKRNLKSSAVGSYAHVVEHCELGGTPGEWEHGGDGLGQAGGKRNAVVVSGGGDPLNLD